LAAVMMTMLTVMFIVLSGTFARIIKAGQTKLANQQVAHAQQRLLQALRLGFYDRWWDIRLNQPAGTAMTTDDTQSIFNDVANILGVNKIESGTPFYLPMANGRIQVTLTADGAPTSVPKPPTGASMPVEQIKDTGTWLDGVWARIHTLPIRIDL